MGVETVNYILKQTELTTIFVAGEYVSKLIQMRKDGLCENLKNVVTFDPIVETERAGLEGVGVELHSFDSVINEGSKHKEPWTKCTEDDSPIFSYTSGTTGDSKGVKLTHKNLISACREMLPVLRLSQEESHISYLPYPHSFEQCVTFFSVM